MRKTTKCLFIGTTKFFCAYKASISLELVYRLGLLKACIIQAAISLIIMLVNI